MFLSPTSSSCRWAGECSTRATQPSWLFKMDGRALECKYTQVSTGWMDGCVAEKKKQNILTRTSLRNWTSKYVTKWPLNRSESTDRVNPGAVGCWFGWIWFSRRGEWETFNKTVYFGAYWHWPQGIITSSLNQFRPSVRPLLCRSIAPRHGLSMSVLLLLRLPRRNFDKWTDEWMKLEYNCNGGA